MSNEVLALQADVAILQKAFALFMRKSSIDDALAWSRAQADAKESIIHDAYVDLQTRIKTGKFRPEAIGKNKSLLMERVKETDETTKFLAEVGKVPPAKPLADAFFAAIKNLDFARTLDWQELPSALRNPDEF